MEYNNIEDELKDEFKALIKERIDDSNLWLDDVNVIFKEAIKEFITDEQRCERCGTLLDDEDLIVEEEGSATILVGYNCSECGHEC